MMEIGDHGIKTAEDIVAASPDLYELECCLNVYGARFAGLLLDVLADEHPAMNAGNARAALKRWFEKLPDKGVLYPKHVDHLGNLK